MTPSLRRFGPDRQCRQMTNEWPHTGLIADAALGELHHQAKRVERVAMRMPPRPDRDELVWVVEAMMTAGDKGRRGIAEIAKSKR